MEDAVKHPPRRQSVLDVLSVDPIQKFVEPYCLTKALIQVLGEMQLSFLGCLPEGRQRR